MQKLVTPARKADEPLILEHINLRIKQVEDEIADLTVQAKKISETYKPLDLVAEARKHFAAGNIPPDTGVAA